MSSSNRIYFPGLNALRFFAAYFVLLHHGETIRAKYALPYLENYSLFRNGPLAVSFFFVLSGFLITYLLLDENQKTSDISIKSFYIRRIRRIWPLYYTLVFIGLCLIPLLLGFIHYEYQLPYDTTKAGILFALFLSFVVNTLYGSHLLEPLWSIGVEEYFYLIWAPLFKFFKRFILSVIIGVLSVKTAVLIFYQLYPTGDSTYMVVKDILTTLKFELMAIGGLGAYWVFRRGADLGNTFIFTPVFQLLMITILSTRLFFHQYCIDNQWDIYIAVFGIPIVNAYTEGGVFLWLILNTSLNTKAFFKLRHPILEVLGDISYGIYMYQMLIIFATILFFKKWLMSMGLLTSTLFYYSFLSMIVIAVSWLSKQYFENIFLKTKKA